MWREIEEEKNDHDGRGGVLSIPSRQWGSVYEAFCFHLFGFEEMEVTQDSFLGEKFVANPPNHYDPLSGERMAEKNEGRGR